MIVDQVQQLPARGVRHEDVDVVRVLPVGEHLDQELAPALGSEERRSEQECRVAVQHARGSGLTR